MISTIFYLTSKRSIVLSIVEKDPIVNLSSESLYFELFQQRWWIAVEPE